jgi:hypothetical protein
VFVDRAVHPNSWGSSPGSSMSLNKFSTLGFCLMVAY